jgi:hypothetical protein
MDSANPRSLAGEHVSADPDVIEASRAELLEALSTLEPYHRITTGPDWDLIEQWATYRENDSIESMLRGGSMEEFVQRQGMVIAFRMLKQLKESVAGDLSRIREALEATEEGEEVNDA